METPTIAEYYREHDPMKRKALLETSIKNDEDREGNEIRKELWEIRYQENSEVGADTRADGFLGLWMSMEFNRDAGEKFFGAKSARKELNKHLQKLKFADFLNRSDLHREILYKECCHLVNMYIKLCETDRSYNSMLCGMMSISKDKAKLKLQNDIYETAVRLPLSIKMEEELGMITKAAKEMYELHFPGEGGLIPE